MLLETLSQSFRLARAVNQTSASFVSKIPTATEPTADAGTATGAAVIDLARDGGPARNGILVMPFGTGSDANTFSIRLIGWRSAGVANTPGVLWVPIPLCEVQVTLTSTVTGVAGTLVPASNYFANIIALVAGTAGLTFDALNPSGTPQIAHFTTALRGCQKIELSFQTGSSATDCNALVAFM